MEDTYWEQVRQLQLKAHRGLQLCKIESAICKEAREKDTPRYLAQHGQVVADYKTFCDDLANSLKANASSPPKPSTSGSSKGLQRKRAPEKMGRKLCPLCREQSMSELEVHVCKLCQVAFRKVEAEDIGTIILWAARQARSADKREAKKAKQS
jgi:hypothetical protein